MFGLSVSSFDTMSVHPLVLLRDLAHCHVVGAAVKSVAVSVELR